MVRIHAEVTPGARTSAYLGSEREGSGVLIDADGLVVTIGYLVTEAMAIEVTPGNGRTVPATLVGLDNNSGLALVRSAMPLAVKPLALGSSAALAERQIVLVAGYGGADAAQAARIVSRRLFAGYWKYLLEDAIFTAPPLQNWSGAALIGADGRLLGINAQEINRRLIITRVSAEGPAERAGIVRGSVVTAVAGERVDDLADFYRKLWAQGQAGVEVALTIEQNGARREVSVKTMNRYHYLKLDTTY